MRCTQISYRLRQYLVCRIVENQCQLANRSNTKGGGQRLALSNELVTFSFDKSGPETCLLWLSPSAQKRPLPNCPDTIKYQITNLWRSTYRSLYALLSHRCPSIRPAFFRIKVRNRLGVVQDDSAHAQSRRHFICATILPGPRLVYRGRVFGLHEYLPDAISKAGTGRAPESSRMNLPARHADQLDECPQCCTRDDRIVHGKLCDTRQNLVHEFGRSCRQDVHGARWGYRCLMARGVG